MILLAVPGLALAARRRAWSGAAGGSIIGTGIAVMHYVGMAAYRVDGIVAWDWRYVGASVLLSCCLSAAAFHVLNTRGRLRNAKAIGLLAFAVAALHFTGMAAMQVTVLKLGEGLSDLTMAALAVTTAVATCIIVGCAAISALIDRHTQTEAYTRLRRMAMHDGLTDLPNRISFIEELEQRFLIRGGWPSRIACVVRCR